MLDQVRAVTGAVSVVIAVIVVVSEGIAEVSARIVVANAASTDRNPVTIAVDGKAEGTADRPTIVIDQHSIAVVRPRSATSKIGLPASTVTAPIGLLVSSAITIAAVIASTDRIASLDPTVVIDRALRVDRIATASSS